MASAGSLTEEVPESQVSWGLDRKASIAFGYQCTLPQQAALSTAHVLRAMRPSFRPVYELLSNGSPDETKVHGTVSLSKNQWTLGQHRILPGPRSLHALSQN